jgi:hypothetical protein
MYKIIIAIDPGANGSITHIKLKDGKPISLPISVKMPIDFKEINQYLSIITEGLDRTLCFIEKVGMRPADMQGGKAFGIMKLLKNFEFLKAACVENNIGFIEVHPSTWQHFLKLKLVKGKTKESDKDRKNRYKEVAQQYFPSVKVTLSNSDALLIMVFGLIKLEDNQYMRENLPEIDLDLLF